VDLLTIQKEIQNKKIFELRQIANQLGVKNVKTMTKQELIDAILKLAEAELQSKKSSEDTELQSSAEITEVKEKGTGHAGEEESAPATTAERRGAGILYFPDEQRNTASAPKTRNTNAATPPRITPPWKPPPGLRCPCNTT